jgi:hypothetical protein
MPDEQVSEVVRHEQKYPHGTPVRVTEGKFRGPAEVETFDALKDTHLVVTDRGVKTWVETKHLVGR